MSGCCVEYLVFAFPEDIFNVCVGVLDSLALIRSSLGLSENLKWEAVSA